MRSVWMGLTVAADWTQAQGLGVDCIHGFSLKRLVSLELSGSPEVG